MRLRKQNGNHIFTEMTNLDLRMLDEALSAIYDRKERRVSEKKFGTDAHTWAMEEVTAVYLLLNMVVHARMADCEGTRCDLIVEDHDNSMKLYREYLRKQEVRHP